MNQDTIEKPPQPKALLKGTDTILQKVAERKEAVADKKRKRRNSRKKVVNRKKKPRPINTPKTVTTSEPQLAYIFAEMTPELETRKAIAEYCGVSTQTLCNWDNDERFQKLRNNLLSKLLKDPSRLDQVWASCFRAATHRKKPNVYAIEKFAQRWDPIFDKKLRDRHGSPMINITNIHQIIAQGVDVKQLEQAKTALRALGPGGESAQEAGEIVDVKAVVEKAE